MLDYGFANYRMTTLVPEGADLDMRVAVRLGTRDDVGAVSGEEISLLTRAGGENALNIEVALPETLDAPVRQGEPIGEIRVLQDGEIVARAPAVAAESVGMPGMIESLLRIFENWRVG